MVKKMLYHAYNFIFNITELYPKEALSNCNTIQYQHRGILKLKLNVMENATDPKQIK